jgi:hypothetical protein
MMTPAGRWADDSAMKSAIVATVFSIVLLNDMPGYSQAVDSKPAFLPVSEQNALVARYCAVCHDDVHRNGGLSLQHFDAATVEPSLAAMMVSKLKSGAIGASGQPKPQPATHQALLDALVMRSARASDPTSKTGRLSAGIVRQSPSTGEVYRLNLTCDTDRHEGAMQLSWSPDPGKSGREVRVMVDGNAESAYLVEGHESMGNGMKKPDGSDIVTTSPAAVILYSTPSVNGASNLSTFLPSHSLTVSNVLPNETIEFSFDAMPDDVRREVGQCSSNPNFLGDWTGDTTRFEIIRHVRATPYGWDGFLAGLSQHRPYKITVFQNDESLDITFPGGPNSILNTKPYKSKHETLQADGSSVLTTHDAGSFWTQRVNTAMWQGATLKREIIQEADWWSVRKPEANLHEDATVIYLLRLNHGGAELTLDTTLIDEKGELEYRQVFTRN